MITKEDFLSAGFVVKVKTLHGETFETKRLYLPGFHPEPYVEWEKHGSQVARIGGAQKRIKTTEDLANFIEKIVPLFCDKTE